MTRDDLVGSWELIRFWFTDDNGAEMDPLGEDAVGHLLLCDDGRYAFTMMRRGRPAYESGDLMRGTDEEIFAAATGYVSFGGDWSFDGERILFGATYSFFPNWVGGTQRRLAAIEDGELQLRTEGAIPMAGKVHRGAARWRRL